MRRIPPVAIALRQRLVMPSQYTIHATMFGIEVLRLNIHGTTTVEPCDPVPEGARPHPQPQLSGRGGSRQSRHPGAAGRPRRAQRRPPAVHVLARTGTARVSSTRSDGAKRAAKPKKAAAKPAAAKAAKPSAAKPAAAASAGNGRVRGNQFGAIFAKGLDLAEASLSLGLTMITRVGVAAQHQLERMASALPQEPAVMPEAGPRPRPSPPQEPAGPVSADERQYRHLQPPAGNAGGRGPHPLLDQQRLGFEHQERDAARRSLRGRARRRPHRRGTLLGQAGEPPHRTARLREVRARSLDPGQRAVRRLPWRRRGLVRTGVRDSGPPRRAGHMTDSRATYDVIVVGAGPAGSSAATFLAQRGVSTLVLDRAGFPRDKVCGDGLTPQAIYWLDRLGCAEEVFEQTKGCIKDCDLYINGEHLLTGGFPKDTLFPDFAILLDRRRFDHILLTNAQRHGARFEPEHTVRAIERDADGVRLISSVRGETVEHRGRLVLGADGVSSVVSRCIGNTLNDGSTAVSLRTYYRDVPLEGSQIKVYFGRDYFPGYGWLFVDDDGFANIGLGYAFDTRFPLLRQLRQVFDGFIAGELGHLLKRATQCGAVSGGAASFYRPRTIVSDRVMLIGDAANHADPLNGGGIHKAMESAFVASGVACEALNRNDCSREMLRLYEDRWLAQFEVDWRMAELLLSIATNPAMKDFSLFLLAQIGRLTNESPQFRDFCSGVFSGVLSRDVCLSPRALYHAFPKDPETWRALLGGRHGTAAGSARLLAQAVGSLAGAAAHAAAEPLTAIDWGMDVAVRATRLLDRTIAGPPSHAAIF